MKSETSSLIDLHMSFVWTGFRMNPKGPIDVLRVGWILLVSATLDFAKVGRLSELRRSESLFA